MQAQLTDQTFKATTLIRITVIAWFFGKIISWKLWLSDRIFPTVAALDFFNSVPSEIHLYLLFFSFSGLFLVFLYPDKKWLVMVLIAIELLSCALDQLRWQPWEYQYLLTLLFFFCYKSNRNFIKAFSLLLVATYIFSGLFKFNAGFLHQIWDNMILQRLFGFPEELISNPILHFSGVLLPVIEIITGLGLLFSKNKKSFVWLAIITHIFLLLALGPSGLKRNIIVWPWNAAMILLVFGVFHNEKNKIISTVFFKSKANIVVFFIVGILPLTNFIGFWPAYFSFKLYSGNPHLLAICVKDTDNNPELNQFIVNIKSVYCPELKSINAAKWALTEVNVPVYPEKSYYIKLKKSWIKKFPRTQSHFMIFKYPSKPENIKEIP